MCLAIPGQITQLIEVSGIKMADVNFGGAMRQVCVEWVPEAKVGDYVLAHVGTALTIVDKQSALESLAAFQEMSKFTKE
jgi:hydrogenase expression/formation protein HypC